MPERYAAQESGRDAGQGDLFGPTPAGGVAIGTLHRFQGAERDVVILSTVINRRASLSFKLYSKQTWSFKKSGVG
jgi:superfamily I DNA and/or RNA helicase